MAQQRHRLYATWRNMRNRCLNPNGIDWDKYGGRGITIDSSWNSFEQFLVDMLPTFKEGLTLDRKDNTLGYSKANCRWATKAIQSQNREISKANTTGYIGVSPTKHNKFHANITVHGKRTFLGSYNTALEGAKAYDTYVHIHELEHTTNGVDLFNTI